MVRAGPRTDRGEDHVDPRAVGEPGIDVWGGFIDAPPDLTDDLLDDPAEVAIVPEAFVGLADLAVALDVDVQVAVDHHLGHGGVVEVLLYGSVTENLGEKFVDDLLALRPRHGDAFCGQAVLDLAAHERLQLWLGELTPVQLRSQFGDDVAVDPRLQLLLPPVNRLNSLGAGFGCDPVAEGGPGHEGASLPPPPLIRSFRPIALPPSVSRAHGPAFAESAA